MRRRNTGCPRCKHRNSAWPPSVISRHPANMFYPVFPTRRSKQAERRLYTGASAKQSRGRRILRHRGRSSSVISRHLTYMFPPYASPNRCKSCYTKANRKQPTCWIMCKNRKSVRSASVISSRRNNLFCPALAICMFEHVEIMLNTGA